MHHEPQHDDVTQHEDEPQHASWIYALRRAHNALNHNMKMWHVLRDMQHEGLLRTTPPLCCYDGILFDTAILVTSGLLCMMPPPFLYGGMFCDTAILFVAFARKQNVYKHNVNINVHINHRTTPMSTLHINHRTTSTYTSIIGPHQCTHQSSTLQCTHFLHGHINVRINHLHINAQIHLTLMSAH